MNVFQSNAAFTPSNPLYPDSYIVMPGGVALWCVVYGNGVPFRVFVDPDSDVDVEYLKEEIQKKKQAFRNHDAASLVLWKVGLYLQDLRFRLTLSCQLHEAEPFKPARTLAERIRLRGDVEMFATELTNPEKKVSALFPRSHPPLEGHVHFLVQLPSSEPIVIIFYAFTTTTTSHRLFQILAGCNS